MKGRIRIFNSAKNLGRIILENDRESGIITFPHIFEDGDLAEVVFLNNDPSQRMVKLTALSKDWHYGFVIISPAQGKAFGNILVTYPQAKGLLFFFASKLRPSQRNTDIRGLKLKFKIQKTLDGKQQAIDIDGGLDRNEWYKCNSPQFGTLEIVRDKLQTGIVQSVVKTNRTIVSSGRIKVVLPQKDSSEPAFGFIKQDGNMPDVFFNAKAYQQFYKQSPSKGAKVNFRIMKTPKGQSVKQFSPPNEQKLLPLERQHGIFEPDSKPGEKIYFPARDFKQTYEREPEAGDLLYFNQAESNRIVFYPDNTKTPEQIIITGRRNQNKRPSQDFAPIRNGFIDSYNSQKGFGFVRTYGKGETYFFHISTYKKTFPGQTPKPYFPVTVTTGISQKTKKFEVKQFSQAEPQSSPPTFKGMGSGLAAIDPTAIYCFYTKETEQVAEVRRFTPEILSEAISCYKDRGLLTHYKLQAIESLIHFGYNDKHITQQNLKEERITILHQQIENAIRTGDMATALKQESSLQRLEYAPRHLRHFSCMKPEYSLDTSKTKSHIEDFETLHPWNIMTDLANCDLEISVPSSPPWLLMHDTNGAVSDNTVPADSCWSLELEDTGLQIDFPPSFLHNKKFALIFDTQDNESEAQWMK